MFSIFVVLLMAAQLFAQSDMKINIIIGGVTKSAILADTQAAKELYERVQKEPITVTLNSSSGFEIWGPLGFSLTTSNQQITAQPGDVILYSGSNICIFYGSNSWSYTRLGKIDGLSESELRTFLKAGESNISVTLSAASGSTGISLTPSPQGEGCRLNQNGQAYTLNGNLAQADTRGIIIRNGKKIIAK